ncbi:MAG: thiazole synthase [Verrucomicrobiota bacterium]|nr:thiazole synthase [Verrucomicrobiota bacterium]
MEKTSTNDALLINGRKFSSRFMIGTGKFSNPQLMAEAIKASESEMVTVALRRIDLDKEKPNSNLTDFIDCQKILLLPNTSGAADAEQAVRLAQISRSSGMSDWIKLEIHPDPNHLLPDPIETLKATEILVKDGFTVFPYINADPVLAKRLEEAGAATVMPLAAPIGTNKGLQTKDMIEIIIEQAQIPVVVDAGLGAPSHAAAAMEMGADACLINTAIATASDPLKIAEAFAMAIRAGRMAFKAGLSSMSSQAQPTSPLTAFLD